MLDKMEMSLLAISLAWKELKEIGDCWENSWLLIQQLHVKKLRRTSIQCHYLKYSGGEQAEPKRNSSINHIARKSSQWSSTMSGLKTLKTCLYSIKREVPERESEAQEPATGADQNWNLIKQSIQAEIVECECWLEGKMTGVNNAMGTFVSVTSEPLSLK